MGAAQLCYAYTYTAVAAFALALPTIMTTCVTSSVSIYCLCCCACTDSRGPARAARFWQVLFETSRIPESTSLSPQVAANKNNTINDADVALSAIHASYEAERAAALSAASSERRRQRDVLARRLAEREGARVRAAARARQEDLLQQTQLHEAVVADTASASAAESIRATAHALVKASQAAAAATTPSQLQQQLGGTSTAAAADVAAAAAAASAAAAAAQASVDALRARHAAEQRAELEAWDEEDLHLAATTTAAVAPPLQHPAATTTPQDHSAGVSDGSSSSSSASAAALARLHASADADSASHAAALRAEASRQAERTARALLARREKRARDLARRQQAELEESCAAAAIESAAAASAATAEAERAAIRAHAAVVTAAATATKTSALPTSGLPSSVESDSRSGGAGVNMAVDVDVAALRGGRVTGSIVDTVLHSRHVSEAFDLKARQYTERTSVLRRVLEQVRAFSAYTRAYARAHLLYSFYGQQLIYVIRATCAFVLHVVVSGGGRQARGETAAPQRGP